MEINKEVKKLNKSRSILLIGLGVVIGVICVIVGGLILDYRASHSKVDSKSAALSLNITMLANSYLTTHYADNDNFDIGYIDSSFSNNSLILNYVVFADSTSTMKNFFNNANSVKQLQGYINQDIQMIQDQNMTYLPEYTVVKTNFYSSDNKSSQSLLYTYTQNIK